MPVLPIYTYGQAVLRKKAKPVRKVDDNLLSAVKDMFNTMYSSHGIGLAANQVAVLQQIIVLDISDMEESSHVPPIVMLNPEVISQEGGWVMEEGCLSIPEIRDDVERAQKIRVRYKDLEFQTKEMEATGLLARVILHEVDHLNGVLFIDHLDPAKQKLLKGRLNKIRRGEVEVSYPVVSESAPAAVETK